MFLNINNNNNSTLKNENKASFIFTFLVKNYNDIVTFKFYSVINNFNLFLIGKLGGSNQILYILSKCDMMLEAIYV